MNVDRPFGELMDLATVEVAQEPWPHIVKDGFFEKTFFSELKAAFPACPESTGPTGFSIYRGDRSFESLMAASPAWKKLYDFVYSQAFVDWCARQFAETFRKDECRIDMTAAHYVDFAESREAKEARTLKVADAKPQDVWARLDIHQGKVGYKRVSHLDHRRRIMTLLAYFSDREENGMEGGELLLMRRKRFARKTRVEPKGNRVVMFACSPRSWHSVPKIRALTSPRNYIQLHLSSYEDAWPR